jgi:hypothetical protein
MNMEDMNKPKAVESSAENARNLIMAQAKAKTEVDGAAESLAPPAGDQGSAPDDRPDDHGKTSTDVAPQADGGNNSGDDTTAAPEAGAAADPEQETDGTDDGAKDWKSEYDRLAHKHEVLQGKYNAEIKDALPKVKAENQWLHDKVAQLQAELDQARQQAAKAPEGGEGGGPVDMSQIDPQAFSDYGPEIVAMAETLKRVTSELSNVKQTTEQDRQQAQQAAEQEYWQRLYSAVPDFDRLNSSPEFLEWLNGWGTDRAGNRMLRNTMLQQSHSRGDAAGVVAVFQDFLDEKNNPPAQPGSQENPPARQQQQQQQQPGHQPNISPAAKAGNAPITPPDDNKTYTRAQVNTFFKDLSAGKFKGQQEWAQAEKARILAAGREGRIL